MNIGIYPGSFNPIHKGHIQLAIYLCRHYSFDEIWLVVSPNNPLKNVKELWDERFRLRLAQVATRDLPQIKASDFEFYLPRPSYTVDTLKALTKQYSEHSFSLIIGSDNLSIFNRWKDYRYIIEHYPIIVYPRQGDNIQELRKQYPQIRIAEGAPLFPISSTIIRQKLESGQSIKDLVSADVEQIIRNTGN